MQRIFIFMSSQNRLKRIPAEEILLVESDRNYCRIKTLNHHFIVERPLCELEKLLPQTEFSRVHRRYIVSMQHITYVAKKHLCIGETIIPIGDQFRAEFFERLTIID